MFLLNQGQICPSRHKTESTVFNTLSPLGSSEVLSEQQKRSDRHRKQRVESHTRLEVAFAFTEEDLLGGNVSRKQLESWIVAFREGPWMELLRAVAAETAHTQSVRQQHDKRWKEHRWYLEQCPH